MLVRRASLQFAAVVALSAIAHGDVVHLRDGSQVQGNVTVCDDETCSIDRKRIERSNIVRITLGGGAAIPPGTAAGVILVDGTVKPGTLTDLNAGFVAVDDTEYDRDDVAEIILETTAPLDIVIGADGRSRSGSVTTCNAASCSIDGEIVPLHSIRWIGLGQQSNTPPAAADADLIFAGAAPVAARLSGLDAETVRTTSGSFARGAVTWIRLRMPQSTDPSGGGPIYRPGPEPPPAPAVEDDPDEPDPPHPPQPPSSPPPAIPPPNDGVANEQVTRGRLWTGTIIGRRWTVTGDEQTSLDVTINARLREYTRPLFSDPPARKVAEVVYLNDEGTVVSNAYRSRSGPETCSGSGDTSPLHHPPGVWSSHMYRKTGSGALSRMMPFEIPSAGFYVLAIIPATRGVQTYRRTCSDGHTTSSYDMPYEVVTAGRMPYESVLIDPQMRALSGGRMFGSYTTYRPEDVYHHTAASWSICLEGTVCPPPTPLDPPAGDPGDAPDDPLAPREPPPADRDWCATLQQLIQAMRTIKDAYEITEGKFRESEQKRNQARDAIFGLNGSLRKASTALLSLASSAASAGVKKAVDVFKLVMGTADGVGLSDAKDAASALGYKTSVSEVLSDAATKEGLRSATRQANAYLEQTGDHSGALRTYAGSIQRSEQLQAKAKQVTGTIGVVTGAADFASNTSSLADHIQDYLEHSADAARHQADMDRAEGQQNDLQQRIDEARRRCSDQQQSSEFRSRRGEYRLASQPLAAIAADAAGPEAAASLLADLQQRAAQLPAQYEAAIIWLLPFLAGVENEMSPALQAAFFGQAVAPLEAIDETLDVVIREQPRFESEFSGVTSRPTTSTTPDPTRVAARHSATYR